MVLDGSTKMQGIREWKEQIETNIGYKIMSFKV
jgi:hypothetical protein